MNKQTHGSTAFYPHLYNTDLSEKSVGSPIILPANGPWIIHDLSANIAPTPGLGNSTVAGAIKISSLTSDISPASDAMEFPLNPLPFQILANDTISPSLTQHIPLDLIAAGSSSVQLSFLPYDQFPFDVTILAGLTYSTEIPIIYPCKRVTVAHAEISTLGETQIGSATLSESATIITGITPYVLWTESPTDYNPLIAYVRLSSTATPIQPSEFLCDASYSHTTLTPLPPSPPPPPRMIPVSIPITPGETISIFCNLLYAPSVPVEAVVHLFYR